MSRFMPERPEKSVKRLNMIVKIRGDALCLWAVEICG